MKTLVLVDISSFIFRAFFAIRPMHTKKGTPVNSVFGVTHMLLKLIDEMKPEYLAIAFDSKEPSFRHQMYDQYKANRSKPPEELVPQFDLIEDLVVKHLQIPYVRQPGFEADDLIATLATKWISHGPNFKVVIVSGDKDLFQLVTEHTDQITTYDTMSGKKYSSKEVEEKMGVPPRQIRDYLALVGDSSDNIPGIKGFGPKTAAELLKEYATLDGILAAADAGKITGKKAEKISTSRTDALISKDLATVKCDVDFQVNENLMKYSPVYTASCVEFFKSLDFNPLATKFTALMASSAAKSESAAGVGGGDDLGANKVSGASKDFSASEAMGANAQKVSNLNGAHVMPRSELHVANANESQNPSQSRESFSTATGFGKIAEGDSRFRLIASQADYEKLLNSLSTASEFAFDLETTDLNPRNADIVGFSFSFDRGFGVYLPCGHHQGVQTSMLGLLDKVTPDHGNSETSYQQFELSKVLKDLKPILLNPKIKKIAQNAKFDLSHLYIRGIEVDGMGADTMVASHLINPEGRHSLDVLAEKYLSHKMVSFEELCGKGEHAITFDQVPIEKAARYSAEDAWATYNVWFDLQKELEKEGLTQVFAEVEMPIVSVLMKCESRGISLDSDYLAGLSLEFGRELREIEAHIHAIAKNPINLNSPKQVAALLFDELKLPVQSKTKTGPSTDASVLEALSSMHEVPRKLLEFREISKLKSTYIDVLPRMVDKKSGRIHTSYHQTGTATGRLSSSDPNLQNIPTKTERGQRIRKAFIAKTGFKLMSLDYSQIELRILAHLSHDPDLVRSFNEGEDVHRRTASELYHKPTTDVTDFERNVAKAINFGLMYGKTAFGLSQELHISRRDAADMIERYFTRYSAVKAYLDRTIEEGRMNGYVTTIMGRKRFLPGLKSSNIPTRNNAERMAMNSPIQGSASDLVKVAMIEVENGLSQKGLKSKLLLQVHDEFILEVSNDEIDVVRKLVREKMQNAIKLSVPLAVNDSVGDTWGEL